MYTIPSLADANRINGCPAKVLFGFSSGLISIALSILRSNLTEERSREVRESLISDFVEPSALFTGTVAFKDSRLVNSMLDAIEEVLVVDTLVAT